MQATEAKEIPDVYVNVSKAAAIMRLSPRRVREMIVEEKLEADKYGKRGWYRIRLRSIERMKNQESNHLATIKAARSAEAERH